MIPSIHSYGTVHYNQQNINHYNDCLVFGNTLHEYVLHPLALQAVGGHTDQAVRPSSDGA